MVFCKMPGIHKLIKCPWCEYVGRSDVVKRHQINKHIVAPPVAPPEPIVAPAHPFDYLMEKYKNGEPRWLEWRLADGNIMFVETNWDQLD